MIINPDEMKVIQLILDNDIVHYRDIERTIGKSRKTVNKYLNHIAVIVSDYDVELVRKRSVGIFFEGEVDQLKRQIWQGALSDNQYDASQLQLSILSELLVSNQAVTMQEMGDRYFISRTTLTRYIKELRHTIKRYGAVLTSNSDGISIQASERVKRLIMSNVLEKYWGKTSRYEVTKKKNVNLAIKVPEELKNIFDVETFQGVETVLDNFQKISTIQLNDYEYQSLVVHLVIAIQRIENGEVLTDDQFIRQQPFSQDTETLTSMLEEYFNIQIPVEEQRYINIHILAASPFEMLTNDKADSQGTQINETNNLIGDFLRTNMTDYDNELIENLTLHLIPALHRFALGLRIKNPYMNDIKETFAFAYNQAIDLGVAIKKEFNVHVNDDELAFIALHIEAFLERANKKVTAVIVCSTGLGTARLLEQRINKYFSDQLVVQRVLSTSELQESTITEDLIISTVHINVSGKKVIVVPPFLDEHSKTILQKSISGVGHNQQLGEKFMALIHESLIFIDAKSITRRAALAEIGHHLEQQGYVETGIGQAANDREALGSTQIDFVAIPHAPIEYVKKPCIAVYINATGIDWANGKVNIIFFLAMNKKIKANVDEIYSYFNNLLEDKQLLQRIIHLTNKAEVIKMLGSEKGDE